MSQTGSLVEALAPGRWPTLVLVGGRFIGLMLVAPLWSMAGIPRSVRAALVVLFSLTVLPSLPEVRFPPDYPGLPGVLLTELLLGLAIGLAGAVFLAGVGVAGEVASQQMGLNLGAALSGIPDFPVGGVGELKSSLALTIYVVLGGHVALLAGVMGSLEAVPPGGAIDAVAGGRAAAMLGSAVFTTAVRVAAPIMVALLLANLALAILARAVPQLNVMAVAFPVTIGIGFLVLGASLPVLGGFLAEWVGSLPRLVAGVVGGFTPVGR